MSDASWLPDWAVDVFKDAATIEPAPIFLDFSIRDDPEVTALFQIAAGIASGETHPADAEELRLIAKHFRRVCRTLDELVAEAMADAPAPGYVTPPRAVLTLIRGGRQ